MKCTMTCVNGEVGLDKICLSLVKEQRTLIAKSACEAKAFWRAGIQKKTYLCKK